MKDQRVPGLLFTATVLCGLGLSCLTACTSKPGTMSDEQLREQAAQATEKAKEQSKEVLQNARVAAANAEQKVNAISAGVQQGLHGNTSGAASPTDLNSASEGELAELPGISAAKARQIIHHRPYSSPHQLVDRGVLTEDQFGAISPEVTAQ